MTIYFNLATVGFGLVFLINLSSPSALKVLFIGNSYTYVNDVPKTVELLSTTAGFELIHDQHTEGGWTWEKHAKSQITIDKINSQQWDVVVLQEYSTRPAFDEQRVCEDTVEPLNQLVDMIRNNNPNTVLQFYLTWGRPFGSSENCESYPQMCTYESMQDRLTQSYKTFACMNTPSRVAPVGEGFRRVKTTVGEDEFFSLYNTHGISDHHASPEGSYLSACLHFVSLFKTSVVGNIATGGLDRYTATLIQQIADDVWQDGTGWEFPDSQSCDLCMCNCSASVF